MLVVMQVQMQMVVVVIMIDVPLSRDKILPELRSALVNCNCMSDDFGRAFGSIGEFGPLHPRVFEA